MEEKKEISPIGRILTIIGAILTIVCVCSKWLTTESVLQRLFDTEGKYSIFQISDLLKAIDYDSDAEIVNAVLIGLVSASIITCVLSAVLALCGKIAARPFAIMSVFFCTALTVMFVFGLNEINDEIKEGSWGLISYNVFGTTATPYISIAASVFASVGTFLTTSASASVSMVYSSTEIVCPNCKALVKTGMPFCDNCGYRLTPVLAEEYITRSGCGAEFAHGAAFCDKYDSPINMTSAPKPPRGAFCTNCGSAIGRDVKFCTNCGIKL